MSGVGAVICEFDPLHTGHKKVIDLAKSRSDVVVGILSGNFTQRSLPSLFDKYSRARAAVGCGVDLVIELPFPWSCAGAEYYSFGAVSIALSLGVDAFFFGSECGDVEELKRAAAFSQSPDFIEKTKELFSDPKTGSAEAFDSAFRSGGFKIGKNDKLAIEYIKSVSRYGRKDVSFDTVKRDSAVAGASKIRNEILSSGLSSAKNMIAPEAYDSYISGTTIRSSREKFDLIEFLFFRFFTNETLGDVFEANGGLGNRLLRIAASSSSPSEFFSSVKTKRYTDSRIRRAALYSLFCVTRNDLAIRPSFSFLLAADKKGRDYLSAFVGRDFEVFTKPSDVLRCRSRQTDLELRADELYSLCSDPPASKGRFVRSSPYIE